MILNFSVYFLIQISDGIVFANLNKTLHKCHIEDYQIQIQQE